MLGLLRHNHGMEPVLVLAVTELVESDWSNALRYYQTIDPALKHVDGYRGVGLWRNVTIPTEHLVTYAYADLDSAERGLEAVASRKLLAETTHTVGAPDVSRFFMQPAKRKGIFGAKVGQFLSKSVRVADPGYGSDLMEELDRIFDELSILPGYLGAEVGRNETLSEEIVGLVAWESAEEFEQSVPPGRLYDIRLYRRVL
jgi:heme-degrading monooxygenase HmoA